MSKTLKFCPMTRVEGHGGIRVFVDNDKVTDAKVDIYEGPRLIEHLTKGKEPADVVSITCRICAICSISHRYACVRAFERALGVEVGPKVKAMRELVDHGENIESNVLHVYLLSLPDLVGKNSAVDLLDDFPDYVTAGLKTKALGNRIMEVISGRATHGENPVIGGFGKWPSPKELNGLKKEAEGLLDLAVSTVDLVASLDMPDYATAPTTFMCVNAGDGKYGFAGDTVLISDGTEFPAEDYRNTFKERVVSHSFAKRSRYKGESFTVGAIARIVNTGERLDGKAGELYHKYYSDEWKDNPMYNVLAQAIEIVFCLEQVAKLVDEVNDLPDEDIVRPGKKSGSGTAAVEAPRGTLYHSYEVKDGRVAAGDIITPTAQNLDDIEKYVLEGAKNLYGKVEEAELQYKLDTIARAYDPCISCSAHMTRVVRDQEEKK